ncbi:MAG TPA: osmoprotectant NAGGN system M42 family peptidase [Polyangiaceae bacterium]
MTNAATVSASSRPPTKPLGIDLDYLLDTLRTLVETPSPTGYTDRIVHWVGEELKRLGIPFDLTRRGAIRAKLAGHDREPARAVISHVDTLGGLVKNLKPNGRLELVPIGFWSSRFAEGGRVTVFTDHHGPKRGTVLPLKASGHTFNEEIDHQPVSWDNVEVRTDDFCTSAEELAEIGYNIGDFVAFDPMLELSNGFVVSRHLDNKAGVATMLATAKAIRHYDPHIPVDCYMLFSISEEVGTGASAILHGDVAEMLAVDNATPAPGQNSRERGVTIAMADSTGPFDYHLTHKLLGLCKEFGIEHQRDVFKYYRCDAASALEAGNDMRVALVCFGADASHGYERTHCEALRTLAELLTLYIQSPPTAERDRLKLGPLEGLPLQPE